VSNKYRNEVDVELNGTKYTLRPTFTCLAAIEEYTNQTIFQFIASVIAGSMKAHQAFFVLETAIKAAGGSVDASTLQRNMMEGGLNEVVKAVSDFLNAAVMSGDLAKKN